MNAFQAASLEERLFAWDSDSEAPMGASARGFWYQWQSQSSRSREVLKSPGGPMAAGASLKTEEPGTDRFLALPSWGRPRSWHQDPNLPEAKQCTPSWPYVGTPSSGMLPLEAERGQMNSHQDHIKKVAPTWFWSHKDGTKVGTRNDLGLEGLDWPMGMDGAQASQRHPGLEHKPWSLRSSIRLLFSLFWVLWAWAETEMERCWAQKLGPLCSKHYSNLFLPGAGSAEMAHGWQRPLFQLLTFLISHHNKNFLAREHWISGTAGVASSISNPSDHHFIRRGAFFQQSWID